jgi:hypothetical protein
MGQGLARPRARDLDEVLHRERLAGRMRRLHDLPRPIDALPDGTMVRAGGDSLLIIGGRPLLWSPAGYQAAAGIAPDTRLLTSPSILAALAAGYRPVLHPSARPVT